MRSSVRDSMWPRNLLAVVGLGDSVSPERVLGLCGDVECAIALARLSEREHQIIRMRYVEGMSMDEIGSVLGVSRQFVNTTEKSGLAKMCRYGSDSREILEKGLVAWLDNRAEIIAQQKMQMIEERMDAVDRELAEKVSDEIDSLSLDEAGLSKRAYNALRNAGIDKLAQVSRMRDFEDLMRIPRMGLKSALEIITVLKEHQFPYRHLCRSRTGGVRYDI